MTEYFSVNDNKGIISLAEIRDDKVWRLAKNTLKNHQKEELRLSLKIAKTNSNIDHANKYYSEVLNKAQSIYDEFLAANAE